MSSANGESVNSGTTIPLPNTQEISSQPPLSREYLTQYQVAIHNNISEIDLFLHNVAQWTSIYHTLSLSAKCTLENELLMHMNLLIQKTESLINSNGV